MTALREVQEEVGIETDNIEVAGFLPSQTSINGNPVYVVAGYLKDPLVELQINPDEVQEAFWVKAAQLTQAHATLESFNVYGKQRRSYVYQSGQRIIWGLTAGIIYSANL